MLGYSAARWHAMLNDLPAALLVVAVLFDFAAAWTKRESLMWAAIWTLWTGVLGGWIAVVAGEQPAKTKEHVEGGTENQGKREERATRTRRAVTQRAQR